MTNQELIDSLKRFYKEQGRSPRAKDCKDCVYLSSHATYSRRFGSWNKALEAAELKITKKSKATKEELIESLKRFYKEQGRSPSQNDCTKYTYLLDPSVYYRVFNSWNNALKAANLQVNQRTDITKEELVESLKRFYKEEGRSPRQFDCDKGNHEYLRCATTYYTRFGSHNKALEAANLPLNDLGSSVGEDEVARFLKEIYSGPIIRNDRSALKGQELDIYLPDINLAIEYNGLYWHSDKFKDKKYHLAKSLAAEAAGIRLIQLFENEWELKRGIVESRIRTFIGILPDKIFARKCKIVELTSKASNDFIKASHIQGTAPASIRYGLIYNNELVAAQTFSKSRYSSKFDFELIRYCNALNTTVVGGASRLFKHFTRKHPNASIISYSDIRWNTGKLYAILGFEETHKSKPNYFYFKDSLELFSRVKFQKHKLEGLLDEFESSWTEKANMSYNGYRHIYDCGNRVFAFNQQKNNS